MACSFDQLEAPTLTRSVVLTTALRACEGRPERGAGSMRGASAANAVWRRRGPALPGRDLQAGVEALTRAAVTSGSTGTMPGGCQIGVTAGAPVALAVVVLRRRRRGAPAARVMEASAG